MFYRICAPTLFRGGEKIYFINTFPCEIEATKLCGKTKTAMHTPNHQGDGQQRRNLKNRAQKMTLMNAVPSCRKVLTIIYD